MRWLSGKEPHVDAAGKLDCCPPSEASAGEVDESSPVSPILVAERDRLERELTKMKETFRGRVLRLALGISLIVCLLALVRWWPSIPVLVVFGYVGIIVYLLRRATVVHIVTLWLKIRAKRREILGWEALRDFQKKA